MRTINSNLVINIDIGVLCILKLSFKRLTVLGGCMSIVCFSLPNQFLILYISSSKRGTNELALWIN